MEVGDLIKIKKNYGVGFLEVIIEKIYSENKILCLNPKINCKVMISKNDIVNKKYYENKKYIKMSLFKNKDQNKDFFCCSSLNNLQQYNNILKEATLI